jgi:hypothetical protein
MADTDQAPPPGTGTRRGIRIAVYVMLVASAGTAFLIGDSLWAAARHGDVPLWAPLAPAVLFTLFVVVYTVDRWLLVTRRRYPLGRAFFQVAFALVFLSLLWPSQAASWREARTAQLEQGDYALRLLDHSDPSVRAAACELLGLRGQATAEERIHELAIGDEARLVRERCTAALEDMRRHAEAPAPSPAVQ